MRSGERARRVGLPSPLSHLARRDLPMMSGTRFAASRPIWCALRGGCICFRSQLTFWESAEHPPGTATRVRRQGYGRRPRGRARLRRRSGCTVHFADNSYDTGPIRFRNAYRSKTTTTPTHSQLASSQPSAKPTQKPSSTIASGRVTCMDDAHGFELNQLPDGFSVLSPGRRNLGGSLAARVATGGFALRLVRDVGPVVDSGEADENFTAS